METVIKKQALRLKHGRPSLKAKTNTPPNIIL